MLVKVPTDLPLVGHIAFGIIDRGTNFLQVRPFSGCPMSCVFCSVDAGKETKTRKNEYIVEKNHLIEWVERVASVKINRVSILIDGVGEPIMHPNIFEIIKGIKQIPKVKEVAIETHGLTLNELIINRLAESGLDRINLSLDTLNPEKAKIINGHPNYNIKKVIEMIDYARSLGIAILLTPVWVPGLNDEDIEELIEFSKNKGIKIAIQKFIKHRLGRGNFKEFTWEEFFNKLKELQEKHNYKLILDKEDFDFKEDNSYPMPLRKGDKAIAKIVLDGWRFNEVIGEAKGRLLTLINANESLIGKEVKVEVISDKDGILMARRIY